jgi:SAM-dependent methyltransferase
VHSTKVLAKFIASLNGRSSPVLLDLGSVTGSNVTFFGEKLGCKIIVEDLSKDIDRAVKEKTLPELPGHLAKRFAQADGSVDGVLCWDVFDYLDKHAAAALAQQLVRILRPEGVVLAFFNTLEPKEPNPAVYTKHVVVDQAHLQYRPYPAARGKQRPFQNRDIQRMFEPLRITEQFLLKSQQREVLFRKAGGAAPAADA